MSLAMWPPAWYGEYRNVRTTFNYSKSVGAVIYITLYIEYAQEGRDSEIFLPWGRTIAVQPEGGTWLVGCGVSFLSDSPSLLTGTGRRS